MANYSLVINSQFKPFSYQEMLAPTLMATQAHQELENQYGELATKANVWEEMANEQADPYAYKMYKTYANDLEEQAGQLAREGLNAASRSNMLNMRARYSKEITPIEQAYTARQKQAEQQQQALLQNPTLMFSRNAASTSLDKYLENPQLNYESYSGALLADQVGKAASALAKQIQDNPRKWRSILGNSYYETLMQKGFNSADVLAAIQNNSNANPELLRIVEDAIDSSNIRSWANKNMLDRAYGYARQGLWNAVGETQYQVLDNWRAKMAAQDYYDKIKFEREHPELPPDDLPVPSTLNFLETTGEEGEIMEQLKSLKAGTQSLRADIFGKSGRVNALKVYEEFQKLRSSITEDEIKKEKAAFEANQKRGEGYLPRAATVEAAARQGAITRILKKKQKALLEKYGVKNTLNEDQYNALKRLGYSSDKNEQLTSITQLTDKLNSLATQNTALGLNLSSNEYVKEQIDKYLSKYSALDSGENIVFEITEEGKQGDSADIPNLSDVNLSEVYYDYRNEGKLTMQVKDSSGDSHFYMIPIEAILSKGVENLYRSNSNMSDEEKAILIHKALVDVANSNNPIPSKTSTSARK